MKHKFYGFIHGRGQKAGFRGVVNFCAFTLAEVLITLAVIGIVAVLTIPSLVASYTERVTVTKVKKAYALLEESLRLAVIENGSVTSWGLTKTVTGVDESGAYITDIGPQLKIFKILSKYWKGTPLPDGWGDNLGSANMLGTSLSETNGGINYAPGESTEDAHDMLMADGTIFMVGQSYVPCLVNGTICFGVDLFIPDKTNKFVQGKNYFYFYIGDDNRVRPGGYRGDTINSFETTCNRSLNKYQTGRGCVAWIIENGNMDYLHCSDLSWGGKTKCD